MSRLRVMLALAAVALSSAGVGIAAQQASALQPNPQMLGLTPALGWSSWSDLRSNPSEAKVEQEAQAMVTSGLAAEGYVFVNIDDWWYQCPGSQGPNVDQWGRWVINSTNYPSVGSVNGIQALAAFVHSLGLKFGIYMTPGISKQAVAALSSVEATSPGGVELGTPTGYNAGNYNATTDPNGISTTTKENNYNCSGMVRLAWSSNPTGAQDYYDSIADELASWGVDYLKFDGITNSNGPDVEGMRLALAQTGRAINLDTTEGSFTTALAPFLTHFATGWEFSPDIECYSCEVGSSSTPLTAWEDPSDGSGVETRFNYVALWQPYGAPGNFNDYDSIEVGNGSGDGTTPDERMTQMSLWALGSSAFILGTDLTTMDPFDLSLLLNRGVLAVDQDGVDAQRTLNGVNQQVFSKVDSSGNGFVGLFNIGDPTVNEAVPANAPAGQSYSTDSQTVSTTVSAVNSAAATELNEASDYYPSTSGYSIPSSTGGYLLTNLWNGQTSETAGTISGVVPTHGVDLYEVQALSNASQAPPNVSFNVRRLQRLNPGQTTTATETFIDNGIQPAQNVQLALSVPSGFTATPTSTTTFASVAQGQAVTATFSVTAPSAAVNQYATATGTATYSWPGNTTQTATFSAPLQVASQPVVINELQTGRTGATTYQYIDLLNTGATNVNIGGDTVDYRSSSASSDTVVDTIPANTMLAAGGYYLLGRSGGYTGTPAANQTFTTSLSSSSGSVALKDPTGAAVDSVGYGTSDNYAEQCDAPAPGTNASPGTSIVRYPLGSDTNSNCADFQVSHTPSPGANNPLVASLASSVAVLTPSPSNGSVSPGWYDVNPTATITATAQPPCASATIMYEVDTGGFQTYSAPFQITGDGVHTLQYYAVDCNNVAEATHTLSVQIDTTPPVTTASVNGIVPVPSSVNGPATITLSASDAGSGFSQTFYKVDSGAWTLYTGPFQITAGGAHSLQYYSTDVAGNIESTHTMALQVNPQATTTPNANVSSTLSLSVGATTPSFGAFTAGVTATYNATVGATVTTTAASSTLSASDPSTTFPGHLVNNSVGGPYEMVQGLQVDATSLSPSSSGNGVYANLGTTNPATVLSYTAPVSNDPVTIGFQQMIASTDALRTGTYTKTITFTLATNTP